MQDKEVITIEKIRNWFFCLDLSILNELDNSNEILETIEGAIYESDDFKFLIEVSRFIERSVINGSHESCHSEFNYIKSHISEQLKYLEQSKKYDLIDIAPHQTLSIETKEKSITEKSIYNLPDDFEVSDFAQWDNDAQFSVPRILDEGEVCFWVYNNIAEVKGIFYESFICETDDDDGEEEEGYMFNRTGEGVRKWYDGGESIFKSWLRISDDKYFNFILDPIYNSFHDIHETGLERAIRKNLSYDWNYGKFALDILFCDFIEPEVKGKDTYYKIVPKYSGVPDLQFFVEEELKLIADVNSYIPLDTIPYFFKYHFEKSKNAIEFLRNAIKTTNNAWGTTALSILCKKTFNEWLEHIIKEYGLNREEVFRQPTTSANVEENERGKRCLFNALQIAIAVTMVNETTELFPKTISKTNSEEVKKFLKDIEEKFKFDNAPERVVREYNKLTIGKDFFQNLSNTDKEGVKKILELGGYKALLKGIK